MKGSLIVLMLCLWINTEAQIPSFENQAVTMVQQTMVSELDSQLPKLSFTAWFNQLIGPQAGVIWQLTECGQPIIASTEAEQDLSACAEVNATLSDGRKVIVAITIGTFKKGIIGQPAFLHAVIERNEQLYEVRRLHQIAEMLLSPKVAEADEAPKAPSRNGVRLPSIKADRTKYKSLARSAPPLPPSPASGLSSEAAAPAETPPQPVEQSEPQTESQAEAPANLSQVQANISSQVQANIAQAPQQDSDVILDGKAVTRVKPIYPPNAKMMNALGAVKVRITIGENGRVIEAKAISGHMALRGAAVEAAWKWIFKPTTVNGAPVKVQGVLTFDFTHNSQF